MITKILKKKRSSKFIREILTPIRIRPMQLTRLMTKITVASWFSNRESILANQSSNMRMKKKMMFFKMVVKQRTEWCLTLGKALSHPNRTIIQNHQLLWIRTSQNSTRQEIHVLQSTQRLVIMARRWR